MLLRVSELSVSYDRVPAVHSVTLGIAEGTIGVILGANGAGKSTIIRTIMGLKKAESGSISWQGVHRLDRMDPHMINRFGIAWVPEGRQIFSELSVRENLRMGAFRIRDAAELSRRIGEVVGIFPVLGERLNQPGGLLSGGQQQMLAVGRALMSRPKALLLDEPSLGLAPKIVRSMFDEISDIKARGVSVLMAEQNARQALRIADYAYILERGELRGEGRATEMADRSDVRAAYLGG